MAASGETPHSKFENSTRMLRLWPAHDDGAAGMGLGEENPRHAHRARSWRHGDAQSIAMGRRWAATSTANCASPVHEAPLAVETTCAYCAVVLLQFAAPANVLELSSLHTAGGAGASHERGGARGSPCGAETGAQRTEELESAGTRRCGTDLLRSRPARRFVALAWMCRADWNGAQARRPRDAD